MLTNLNIRNFVVIDQAEIEFSEGLTAIIGETGAGKSIIIQALACVLGGKAGVSQIKDKNKKAFIEASFVLDDKFLGEHPKLKAFLDGDNQLVLSLTITPKGNITRKANLQTLTAQTLKELCADLADIHSQRDSSALYDKNNQLILLDKAGGKELDEALNNYNLSYRELLNAKKKVEDLKASVKDEDPDFLRFRIDEINAFNLQPNEIEEDEEKLNQLSDQADIGKTLEDLSPVWSQISTLTDELSSYLSSLTKFSATETMATEALDALNILEEKVQELMLSSADEDAAMIDKLNARLFSLDKLRQKYGSSTKEILNTLESFKQRLASLEDYEGNLKALQDEVFKAEEDLTIKAKSLSQCRKKTATKLISEINKNLASLGLAENGFNIEFQEKDGLDSHGMDQIEFTVNLNKSNEFLPLRKACSGGESSRIMLSLKTALANENKGTLMVFDEIDTGISGNIAFKAGAKLHQLSQEIQVICITHLPQVAAFSDNGLYVEKRENDNAVESLVTPFTKRDKATRIATLISGSNETKAAIQAAQQLIKEAENAK